MTATLVLGPLLRWVGTTQATVWVEVSDACTVTVLGSSARTVQLHGRHYALVVVDGLAPASETAYDVRLDGDVVWPEPDSHFPHSVIRTQGLRSTFRVSFGSCRLTMRPEHVDSRFHGVCALRAVGESGRRNADHLPDLLFLAGDQVYADELTDEIREIVRHERSGPRPPKEQIADYEEYARLYGIAWGESTARWLLSTVPSMMIFDDHDVIDDWNTSQEWRDDIRREPWWRERIIGALASYWIYQHLGNLAPDELARDELWCRVRAHDGDAGEIVDEFAERADTDRTANRWSYVRDWGRTRLLVVDTRCARKLDPGARDIVGQPDWDWCLEQIAGDYDHLLVGSSLPLLLPRPLSDVEGWTEALADGVWGPRWARIGERLRQGVDLEHWAAFRHSFVEVCDVLADVSVRPGGPRTVAVLSGDVHYSFLARARREDGAAFAQVTCSPLRNPLGALMRYMNVFAFWQPVAGLAKVLAARAHVAQPRVDWDVDEGPWFDNAIATVRVEGPVAEVVWQSAIDDDGRIGLAQLGRAKLSR